MAATHTANDAASNWTYQGVSVDSGPYNIWQNSALKHAMDDVVAINANSVAIVARYTMDTGKSSTVYASDKSTESLENIEQAIQDAQARGLSVMLKPHLTPVDGTFSGLIKPADAASWFASYKSELLDLARLAEANDVPLLSLGNELTSVTGPRFTSYWEDIISSVREVYSGQLTLAAQYYDIDKIEFWDDLDIIGVNAYTTLTDVGVPTAQEAYDAWTSDTSSFALRHGGLSAVEYTAKLAEQWDRPVIITEMGFRSIEGAGKAPGDFSTPGTESEAAQAALYEGFLKAWGEAGDWFQGTFLWGWNVAKGQDNDYSPQGKLAFDIIADAFGGDEPQQSTAELAGGEGTVITIRVAGRGPVGYTPELLVTLDGLVIGQIEVTGQSSKGQFIEYTLNVGDIDPSRLQLFFDNPVANSSIHVDWIEVNGLRYQAEGFGVDNNANPTSYTTAGVASLFTGGSLNFDLKYGIADGQYNVHAMKATGALQGTESNDFVTVIGKSVVHTAGGDDVIDASKAEGSYLDAGAGNDVIRGSSGNDVIVTGSGRDRIIVVNGDGTDIVTDFDPLHDVLDFTQAKATTASLTVVAATVNGVQGTLVTFKSTSLFLAGVKPTELSPENFAFTRSQLDGPAQPDPTIRGTDGNDRMVGTDGDDKMVGGAGNDVLIGSAGADQFDGGAGFDIVSYENAEAFVRADLSGQVHGLGQGRDDTFAGIEGLIGSRFNDWLYGDMGDNLLDGGDGDDVLSGGAGNDTLHGGSGDDKLFGNDGDDVLIGGAGADTLNGGAGFNRASYADAKAGIRVDMRDSTRGLGDAAGDSFVSIQGIIGSRFDDEILGDHLANVLDGGDGDDVIFGRIGDDTLIGGGGNDILVGGAGADRLIGGDGFDTASYEDAAAFVRVDLSGERQALGDARGDSFDSIEGIAGSRYDDLLYGNDQDNVISGGQGNDQIGGGAGNDRLYGGEGNDQLYGGDGDDYLEGGSGADILNGNSGYNTASYAGASAGVIADLANAARNTGDAKGDTYISIQGLRGSQFSDSLYGNSAANTISGGDGDDYIFGGKGNDILRGEGGNDTLVGGEGKDTFEFSNNFGHDVIKDFDGRGGDVISLNLGLDYDTFDEIMSAMTIVGNDALFDFGDGNSILLENYGHTDFQPDDFSLF